MARAPFLLLQLDQYACCRKEGKFRIYGTYQPKKILFLGIQRTRIDRRMPAERISTKLNFQLIPQKGVKSRNINNNIGGAASINLSVALSNEMFFLNPCSCFRNDIRIPNYYKLRVGFYVKGENSTKGCAIRWVHQSQ